MASLFENIVGGTVVFGGIAALFISIPIVVYKTFWGEDYISPPETVFVPSGQEMVIRSPNSSSVFVVPPREVDIELTMHLVDYNDDVQTYGTIKKMTEQGFRPANLAECEAYLSAMEAKGKVPFRVFCLGSLYTPTGRLLHGESRVHYSAIYPKEPRDRRYAAKGILIKTYGVRMLAWSSRSRRHTPRTEL